MKLNEIFYSIQGEGFWTGTPAIFIRFAGCNLNCNFCDTDFAFKFDIMPSKLLNNISSYKSKHIILTGGEPALQLDINKKGYSEFIRILRSKGYYIQIETNGTIKLPNNIDWITVSPKDIEYPKSWIIKKGDELKIINQGQDIKQYENLDFKYYYLQPCEIGGNYNFKDTIKKIKENPKWKLSIQIQKLLKIK